MYFTLRCYWHIPKYAFVFPGLYNKPKYMVTTTLQKSTPNVLLAAKVSAPMSTFANGSQAARLPNESGDVHKQPLSPRVREWWRLCIWAQLQWCGFHKLVENLPVRLMGARSPLWANVMGWIVSPPKFVLKSLCSVSERDPVWIQGPYRISKFKWGHQDGL